MATFLGFTREKSAQEKSEFKQNKTANFISFYNYSHKTVRKYDVLMKSKQCSDVTEN